MQKELATPKPTFWQKLPPIHLPLRWIGLILGPLVVFGLFLLAVGVNPIDTYIKMLNSALGDRFAVSEVLIRAAPVMLAALATAVPSRVRLLNVGAEGQLVIGALFATAAAVFLGETLPGIATMPILLIAGALGGALWAGISGYLRVKANLNETISSLLLNYVAVLVVGYLIHGILRDPDSFNWPYSPPFADPARFATFGATRLHWGVIIAPVAAVLVWYVLSKTFIGLRLKVVGGNPLAAKRAGLNVERIQLWAFFLAGAFAGLAGVIEVAGVEGRLRPTTGVGLGYIGFLASWMVSHNPLWLIGSSLLLAVIAVSGDALQITASLPASSVNILMALVLIGVLARFDFSFGKKKKDKE